jgi:broad specificity phosphatase PhoE
MSWFEARRRWPVDPDFTIPPPPAPDAESWQENLRRSMRCLSRLLDDVGGGRIVVIGHVETLESAYSVLLETEDLRRLRLTQGNCCVTSWYKTPLTEGPPTVERPWTMSRYNHSTERP